jgi:exodeoxyribonuclease V alpha subunit
VIDEASMVDTLLMYHLLKAIPLRAALVLVGDVDQLPSVGAGNVLRDIIDSGSVPVVRLDEIFRQSRESMIVVNAHRINRGRCRWPARKRGRISTSSARRTRRRPCNDS